MSDLTPCNFCTLASIRVRAARSGATVGVRVVPEGEPLAGWTQVFVDGELRSTMQVVGDSCGC